jgi:hypothetical protein
MQVNILIQFAVMINDCVCRGQVTLSTFTSVIDRFLAVVITHYVAADIPELNPGTGAVSANATP